MHQREECGCLWSLGTRAASPTRPVVTARPFSSCDNPADQLVSLFHLDSVRVSTASVVAAALGIPIFTDPLLKKEYVPVATSMSSSTSPGHLPAFKLARYAAHLCLLHAARLHRGAVLSVPHPLAEMAFFLPMFSGRLLDRLYLRYPPKRKCAVSRL